ncbi:general odorant-binding protein 84a isoform X2 [Drosophila navojoa]|uniref:general odorant-binding protein 84a isoform X2 n=1 Tax=Drosophila navojoa TaxID=7232 RepID=UPI0008468B6D|nr:general odorant-binding protein 84a isoform X2 [Drosophila navojoa]
MSRFHLLKLLFLCGLCLTELRADDLDIDPDTPEVQSQFHARFLEVRTACAEEFLLPYGKSIALLSTLSLCGGLISALSDRAKDNGDIFIIDYDSFDGDVDDISTTTEAPRDPDYIDFDAIMHGCNASFITPMSYVLQFNNTGKLADETDLTSMCYFRCFFEKSGIVENFKLVPSIVRKYIWPATGDSIEYCESQGISEPNACKRTYAIVQCAMMRALTDARNKPMV